MILPSALPHLLPPTVTQPFSNDSTSQVSCFRILLSNHCLLPSRYYNSLYTLTSTALWRELQSIDSSTGTVPSVPHSFSSIVTVTALQTLSFHLPLQSIDLKISYAASVQLSSNSAPAPECLSMAWGKRKAQPSDPMLILDHKPHLVPQHCLAILLPPLGQFPIPVSKATMSHCLSPCIHLLTLS